MDGSEPLELLGHEPQGIVIHTPDGCLSAQLAKPDGPGFASGDFFAGTAEGFQDGASSVLTWRRAEPD